MIRKQPGDLEQILERVLQNIILPVCSALVWNGSDRKQALSVRSNPHSVAEHTDRITFCNILFFGTFSGLSQNFHILFQVHFRRLPYNDIMILYDIR